MRVVLLFILSIFLFACADEKAAEPRYLAFNTTRDGNFEVYLLDLDSMKLKNLSEHESTDFGPAFSADGTEVWFYSERDGNREIYYKDLLSGTLFRVTNHPAKDLNPVPSPQGDKVYFISDREEDGRELFSMNRDGSKIQRITFNQEYEEAIAVSPDGKQLAFCRLVAESDTGFANNGEIFIMDINGENERRLTNLPGFQSGPSFSPDGKKIAFYGEHNEGWDIFILDLETGKIRNFTNDRVEQYSPVWSADGKWLAYTEGTAENYDIRIRSLDGAKSKLLTRHPKRDSGPAFFAKHLPF